MLLVEQPPGYEPERDYANEVVLSELLGLSYRSTTADRPDVRIQVADDADGRAVIVPDGLFGLPAERWLTPASLPASPLPRLIRDPRRAADIPVLYGRPLPGGQPQEATPDGVRLAVDVFGSAFFMLTRYEELVTAERDAHGRFPASASVSAREGILERPIVNEYVELLWSALRHCWPGLRRKERQFHLRLTHDVDHPLSTVGVPAAAVLRSAGGDVIRRRDPDVAFGRLRSLLAGRRGEPAQDPYDTFDFLTSTSERHGLRSAFYFMSHDRGGEFDPPPLLDHPRMAGLMRRIHSAGHEVGLHPSYDSFGDPARTAREFSRLLEAAEGLGIRQERWGGRQHYLRWESPTTWQHWDRAGLSYDSSVGYSEAVGFRSGICDEHPVFDVRARRRLGIRELPLHVMDVTLFEHLGLSPGAAHDRVLLIARACREHSGPLVLLWHNNTLAGRRARRWYRSLVREIAG
jgi:uncharacterized protein DUF7033